MSNPGMIPTSPRKPLPDRTAEKYLTFRCASEEYAVPVSKVREIIGWQEITTIPLAPEYVKGVLNLRGRVIPVVDLRLKLGVAAAPSGPRTCIIIMQLEERRGAHCVGVVVDTVSEVITMTERQRQNTRDFGQGLIQGRFVCGVANVRDSMKLLLDVDATLSRQEAFGAGMEPYVA